jgi:hypothetical protein
MLSQIASEEERAPPVAVDVENSGVRDEVLR